MSGYRTRCCDGNDCPSCARDDRAVEAHRTMLCPWREITPCRFGYEEHDGARYCFEHAGFLEAGVQSRRCNRAPADRAEVGS